MPAPSQSVARWSRWLALWLLALALCVLAAPARPADALALSDAVQRVDAWPAVTLATDAARRWTLDDVLAHPDAFAAAATPPGNLGPRPAIHWLKLPLHLAAPAARTWWFAIDYPLLDRADLYLLRDGQPVVHRVMGNHRPYAQRPLPTRLHAVALELQPGVAYELLLRVDTAGAAILPMSLMTLPELMRHESDTRLWQGLAAGFGLCLFVYAVVRAAASRDPMFLWFAVAAASGTLFFFTYHGLAAQYLWPHHVWLTRNAAVLWMYGILAGGFMFTEHTLAMAKVSRVASGVMHAGAAVSLLGAVLFAGGVASYSAATVLLASIGLVPMLIGLPVAAYRAHGGDRAARWIFLGFCLYSLGVATMAALNAGLVPATRWNLHAFQAGSLLLLLCWIMVMSVRAEEVRHAADRARIEQERLTLIARTDALTGLLNRRGLHEALEPRLARAGAGRLAAVYLIDLDGFKAVNDSHGHDAGDELLRQIGQRLCALAGQDALVARLGGDEFVVASSWLADETEATALAERLQVAVAEPFTLPHGPCSVGMTLGYALAPRHGTDATTLLKRADTAMYAGKQAGRGRSRAYGGAQPMAARNA
ncbi:sensor domain-containing diguanylate cyclase [Schlegelella sp. S2-27]|uniref:Sensor domain-containing diguanylate cyclase n=1 Tax=Caldimonas mangrovi TaxID=2944811 RepID=A0ABT0YSU1_9BURK|nr:diguanylate cyclase [Caldimonas mangrovi]MCM5681181.1 sensor domain-containing diguanylate cyclase [Caldimonas mangrovi]